MRVSPVSNYVQKNKLSFGRFQDENAKSVVKKTLTAPLDEKYMQRAYNDWFKTIDSDENFIAYTSKSGTVKGKFDDEFMKSNKDDDYLMYLADSLKEEGHLDDLSVLRNIENIKDGLNTINDVLDGINVADKHRSKDPYGDETEKRAIQEYRINYLAD